MASWSKPITEQTNLYYAEEQGWFKEKGIDFTFVPGAEAEMRLRTSCPSRPTLRLQTGFLVLCFG